MNTNCLGGATSKDLAAANAVTTVNCQKSHVYLPNSDSSCFSFFFFYVAVNIKLTSPPRLVNLAVGIGQWCLVRSLLCAFVRRLPSVLPPLIYLQCKSVLGSKAIDEWKWKANELWSVSAYLPSCAFKNALRLLLSRTQEKPPEPYSTIRQTLLTRVFVSLSNTDKVLYTIMFACVPLRVLFFFFFFPTQLCLYCSVNLLYQSAHFLFLSDFRTFQMADFLAYVSSFPWKLRVLRYILILLMCGLCSNKYYDPVDLNLEHAI